MRHYAQQNTGSGRIITALLLLLGMGALIIMMLQNRDVPPEKMAIPTIRPTVLAELPTRTATVTASPSATTTATVTATQTQTQTATLTLSPTVIPPSETPAETPFNTFTPLPTPPCQTIVVNESGAFIRNGPGIGYAAIETVPQHVIFEVLGFLQDGDGRVWYNIRLLDGTPGWISSGVSEILRENMCSELAQAPTIPPTPIPVTNTPNPNSISLYPTRDATPFCGDGVCNPGESSAVCSVDCPFSGGSGLIPNDRTPMPYEITQTSAPAYVPDTSSPSGGQNTARTPIGHDNPGSGGGEQGVPFSCDIATGVTVSECVALSSLYLSTNGQNWLNNSNWMTNRNVCSWYGVSCNPCALTGGNCIGSSVYVLYLANNNLQGPIPANLGSLPNLLIMHLENNNLTGIVPQELTNLTQLRTLCLHGNPNLDTTLPPPLDTIGCR